MAERNSTNSNVSGMSGEKSASWLTFPIHERLSGPDASQLLRRVEHSCQKLEAMTQTGQEAEKARARLALKAYNRTVELLDHIRSRQEEMRSASK
jgi:hypothetical protein